MENTPHPFRQLELMNPPVPLRAAVIGAGYWGPNLARNFNSSLDWDLAAIVDTNMTAAMKLSASIGNVPVYGSVEQLLSEADVDAVAIATPARTHDAVAIAALEAGKHVVVEKPLAASREQAVRMMAAAEERGLVLMTDHTYCYTNAALKIRELIADGSLGDILFIDSVRINLGLIQPDVDVFWDLAPHDLSVMDFVLPGGLKPAEVTAYGADPLGAGRACVGHLNFELPNNAMAHIHVNWLSPTKIRQMVIGGSKRTLVWDDLNPQQRISVYDRGVSIEAQSATAAQRKASAVSYRLGDTWSPALPETEALGQMVGEFARSIREGRQSRTSGAAGLRVLEVLEAATRSLANHGAASPVHSTVLSTGLAGSSAQMEGTR